MWENGREVLGAGGRSTKVAKRPSQKSNEVGIHGENEKKRGGATPKISAFCREATFLSGGGSTISEQPVDHHSGKPKRNSGRSGKNCCLFFDCGETCRDSLGWERKRGAVARPEKGRFSA